MPDRLPAFGIRLVRRSSVSTPVETYESPRNAVDLFRKHIGDSDREHLVALYLDANARFLGLHVVAVGGANFAYVTAREVFRAGIACTATEVILLHNHPSGDSTPSDEDLRITRTLELAGFIVDVAVADHIVVGTADFVSMREEDLMILPPDENPELTAEEMDERLHRLLFPKRARARKRM